jgi:hypothetical protein
LDDGSWMTVLGWVVFELEVRMFEVPLSCPALRLAGNSLADCWKLEAPVHWCSGDLVLGYRYPNQDDDLDG